MFVVFIEFVSFSLLSLRRRSLVSLLALLEKTGSYGLTTHLAMCVLAISFWFLIASFLLDFD